MRMVRGPFNFDRPTRSWKWRGKQVRLSELEKTCYEKSPNMVRSNFSEEHRPLACRAWRLAKHTLSGGPPESAREPRALPDPTCYVVDFRASRLLRARYRKIDSDRSKRSGSGTHHCFRDTF